MVLAWRSPIDCSFILIDQMRKLKNNCQKILALFGSYFVLSKLSQQESGIDSMLIVSPFVEFCNCSLF